MKKLLLIVSILLVSALSVTPLAAQTNIIFAGSGTQSTPTTPFVIGYLYLVPTSPWIFGFDMAGEGTKYDNTYNNSSIAQSLSFNAIVGRGFRVGTKLYMGVSGLLGARQVGVDCPTGQSYLGFQCYAGEDPSVSYTINVGVMAHLTYRNVMVGARITGASKQALIGFAF